MKQLVIKNPGFLEFKAGPFTVVRMGIGIFSILSAIAMVVAFWDKMETLQLISAVFLLLSGTGFLSNSFGTGRTWFRKNESSLTVKWINMIKPLQIHFTGISKVVLERKRISIHRKTRKPVKLNLDFLEKQQRKEAFEFFIAYSEEKSIAIEKRFF